MPANLTPQYLEAEEKYKQAQTPEEKLLALQEMLRTIPKHKGTEKLQADIKRKISEQKKSMASGKGKKKKPSYYIDKHGHPQVVVIGPPNSGKSFLVSRLTGVQLKVADYPYTTTIPQAAIMHYENVRIQLVDTPPISVTHMESWLPNIVRGGDAEVVVVDLSSDEVLEDLESIIAILAKQRLYLNKGPEELEIGDMVKKALLVGNKSDKGGAREIFELLDEAYREKFERIAVSAATGEMLDFLKQRIFAMLNLIRVYPKPPGKQPDRSSPILLKQGSTVFDLADQIHHEMAKNLKGARLWGSKEYVDGQQAPRNYELKDEEIVELIV